MGALTKSRPDTLATALTAAKPNLLTVALTKAKANLLATALQEAETAILGVALTESRPDRCHPYQPEGCSHLCLEESQPVTLQQALHRLFMLLTFVDLRILQELIPMYF